MNSAKETAVWVFTIRGIFALLFGLAAVFWPGLTLLVLVFLFSAFILASGLVGLVSGLGNLGDDGRSILSRLLVVLISVIEIGVGVYLIRHTNVALATFILIIGFTLLARGVFDVLIGLFEENSGVVKTATVISGIFAALAGIIILMNPVSGGVAFVWILGLYALVTGPILIALGLSAKNELNSKKPRKA